LTKVKVGRHVWVDVSRRTLCDNCSAQVCPFAGERRLECEYYTPNYVAFKKCASCGGVFEVFSSIGLLDYDLCPRCNALLSEP